MLSVKFCERARSCRRRRGLLLDSRSSASGQPAVSPVRTANVSLRERRPPVRLETLLQKLSEPHRGDEHGLRRLALWRLPPLVVTLRGRGVTRSESRTVGLSKTTPPACAASLPRYARAEAITGEPPKGRRGALIGETPDQFESRACRSGQNRLVESRKIVDIAPCFLHRRQR